MFSSSRSGGRPSAVLARAPRCVTAISDHDLSNKIGQSVQRLKKDGASSLSQRAKPKAPPKPAPAPNPQKLSDHDLSNRVGVNVRSLKKDGASSFSARAKPKPAAKK